MSWKPLPVSPHHNNNEKSYCRDRGGVGRYDDESHSHRVSCTSRAEVLVGATIGSEGEGDTQDQAAVEMNAEVEQEVERIPRLPTYQPTKSDYDQHGTTHCPYRPWCRHCVEGRGQEFGHFKRTERDPNRIPLVAFDYCGLSDKGELMNTLYSPDDETSVRVLVVSIRTADDLDTCVFGHWFHAKAYTTNSVL